jgi:hypothetical protein
MTLAEYARENKIHLTYLKETLGYDLTVEVNDRLLAKLYRDLKREAGKTTLIGIMYHDGGYQVVTHRVDTDKLASAEKSKKYRTIHHAKSEFGLRLTRSEIMSPSIGETLSRIKDVVEDV